MDIYQSIDSKDIREHCRKLGHRFNTVESAYLVWQSRNTPLAEKHEAWREIIDTMPDMEWSHAGEDWGSIHWCLERYMELEDRLVEDFYQTDETIRFEYGGFGGFAGDRDKKFTSVEELLEAKRSGKFKLIDGYKALEKPFEILFGNSFEVCKRKRRSQGPDLADARFSKYTFELLSVTGRYGVLSEEECEFGEIFDRMWVYIPTPLQTGDIVVAPDGPAVLYDWKLMPENKEYIQRMEREGALRDMVSSTMYMERGVSNEFDYHVACSQPFYPRLEYYRQEPPPEHSFITAISSYYAGELDLPKLLSAYYLYKEEMNLKALRWAVGDFSQENGERMGIGSIRQDED